jgi:hypothetical protein
VLEAWATIRPAHAWLNLVGFVSLVIATTLLHFFPTVIGARIKRTGTAVVTVAGIASGTAIVALGFILDSDLDVRVGAIVVLVGALSLAVYAAQVWRTRARWSGDASWHRFAIGGLVASIAWFEVGMAIATGRLLVAGADPAAATATVLVGPLLLGWVGLAVLASATHLVPAIGPGDPMAHAAQRILLGTAATGRLVLVNLGIACLAIGLWPGAPDWLAIAGLALSALSLGGTVGLLILAIARGLGNARSAGRQDA